MNYKALAFCKYSKRNVTKTKFVHDLLFSSASTSTHINKSLSGKVNVSQTGSNTG